MSDTNQKSPDGTDATDSAVPHPSRREVLKTVAAGIAGAALSAAPISGFPQILKREIKDITLRHIGVSYAVQRAIGVLDEDRGECEAQSRAKSAQRRRLHGGGIGAGARRGDEIAEECREE